MTRRIVPLALAFLALALAVAACGGDDDDAAADQPAATDTADGGNGDGGGGTTLQIAADPDGALAYDTTSLEAPAGEITIEFTNDAQIPHNVVIEGVEGAATETITASTDTLTVTLEPGEYTFFCSVPGHRAGGMEGTLTVT